MNQDNQDEDKSKDLQNQLQQLLQEYKTSRQGYLKSKSTYEALSNIMTNLNHSKLTENTESEADKTPIKKVPSKPKVSKLSINKSRSSIGSTSNSEQDCFIELQHKIHQFENYKNLMRQAREPPEKAEFLKMLHSEK